MGGPLSLRESVINPSEVDPKNWISRQKTQPIFKKTIIRKREFLKIYGLLKYFKTLDLKWPLPDFIEDRNIKSHCKLFINDLFIFA